MPAQGIFGEAGSSLAGTFVKLPIWNQPKNARRVSFAFNDLLDGIRPKKGIRLTRLGDVYLTSYQADI